MMMKFLCFFFRCPRKKKRKFEKEKEHHADAMLQHFRPFMAADCSHGRASFFFRDNNSDNIIVVVVLLH